MGGKNINILVLDEENSVFSELPRFLEDKGYNVVSSNDSEQAFEYLKKNAVHIAIVDISVPSIEGISLLGMIKDANVLTQIIMMGTSVTADKLIASFESGVNDFILKHSSTLDHVASVVEESEKKLLRWQNVFKNLGVI